MRTFVRLSICLLMATLLFPVLASGGVRPPAVGNDVILPPPNTCRGAFPGDANADGGIDISDVVTLIDLLCHEGDPLPVPANGDVNADCEVDLDDVYYLIDSHSLPW